MEAETPEKQEGGKKPGPHTEKRLSASFVRTAPPGRHTDGGGLYLQVDESGARRWLLRLTVRRKRCDYGLGSAKVLSLAEAREHAIEMRKVVLRGGNPKVRQREEDGKHLTFEDLSRRVHDRKFKENKNNGKHIAQWITTLETYAFPVLGKMSVEDVSQIEIEAVLDPIWTVKPETARRVLQRITTVFDHACGMGYAPIHALIAQQTRFQPGRDMVLIWGMRAAVQFYALDELAAVAAQAPGLRVILAAEEGTVPLPAGMQLVQGTAIDALASGDLVVGRDIYAAGPPMLLRGLVDHLTKAGVDPARLHMDSFGV